MSATNGKECEHNAGYRWLDVSKKGQFAIQRNGLGNLRLVRRVSSSVAMDAVRGDEIIAEGREFYDIEWCFGGLFE